jgi:hypothetical protein
MEGLGATVANVDSAGSHLVVNAVTLTLAGTGQGSLGNAEAINGGAVSITGTSGLGGAIALGETAGLPSSGSMRISGTAFFNGVDIREAAPGLGFVTVAPPGLDRRRAVQ